ncbi:hypothetical protein NPIL_184411, partial [Nephila pilipes]
NKGNNERRKREPQPKPVHWPRRLSNRVRDVTRSLLRATLGANTQNPTRVGYWRTVLLSVLPFALLP